jgi:hypothetical protein
VPVQFGPTRLPSFGEDDWFIYTEIRIEAWLMRTLKAGRAPLVGQDDHTECHGDDQRCDLCQGLDKVDNDSTSVEVEVEGDRATESVVAPSDAVTVTPVVSELDLLLLSVPTSTRLRRFDPPLPQTSRSLVRRGTTRTRSTSRGTRFAIGTSIGPWRRCRGSGSRSIWTWTAMTRHAKRVKRERGIGNN